MRGELGRERGRLTGFWNPVDGEAVGADINAALCAVKAKLPGHNVVVGAAFDVASVICFVKLAK